MTRLIVAEELKEYLEEAYEAGCIDKYYNMRRRTIFDEVLDCVDEQPTVDAVRVIRCKDCKYYRWEIDMCDEPHSTAHNIVHEDDYCSRAERKEE